MALSQFTHYTNFTVGAPALNGLTGSLIDVLDFCLVSGSGWIRTMNSSSTDDGVEVFAGYRQPSGSGMYLFVNDSGPGAPAVAGKEAWVCGWENLTNMSGSLSASSGTAVPNFTSSVGGGYGQFPLRYQSIVNLARVDAGLVVRKSVAATGVIRNWQVFADAYTFYMFVQAEGTTAWWAWWFGDIYSFAGASDMYRCVFRANGQVNVVGTSTRHISDQIHTLNMDVNNSDEMYMPRHVSGKGFSILVAKSSPFINSNGGSNSQYIAGAIPIPNPVDNSIVIAPITVFEFNWPQSSNAARKPMRGRMRGFWHYCHPVATAVNGQMIYGTGEYAGKTFQVISPGVGNSGGGVFLIERSATVETN